jgi:hypothetical protein
LSYFAARRRSSIPGQRVIRHVELLAACARAGTLPARQALALSSMTRRAFSMVIPSLSLSAARELPAPYATDLADIIEREMDFGTLRQLARAWEPDRALDVEVRGTLARDLAELVRGTRDPYTALEQTPLNAARALPPPQRVALRHAIERLAPRRDLKRLLWTWDRAASHVMRSRAEAAAHLIELLDGLAEPSPRRKPLAQSAGPLPPADGHR